MSKWLYEMELFNEGTYEIKESVLEDVIGLFADEFEDSGRFVLSLERLIDYAGKIVPNTVFDLAEAIETSVEALYEFENRTTDTEGYARMVSDVEDGYFTLRARACGEGIVVYFE